jgi:branched-chain amino acid transport system ATP-binding protein
VGLSLEVPEGKIVTLLGTNGAGKTTTLKAASNLLALENGQIGEGRIRSRAVDSRRTARQAGAARLFHVREGRRDLHRDDRRGQPGRRLLCAGRVWTQARL